MNKLQKSLVALGLSGAGVIAGVNLIAPSEGLVNKPYLDPIGLKTVCYGQQVGKIANKYYTDHECAVMLAKEIRSTEAQVDKLVKVPLNDYQKAAMIDFAYNKGIGNFKSSTMLGYLNAGNTVAACDEMLKWVFAGQCKQGQKDCVKTVTGKWKFKFKGLVKRQELERKYCLGKIETDFNNFNNFNK